MGTTAGGLRFPEPEERVNQGNTSIKNLADDVQAKLIAAGGQVLGAAVAGADVTVTSTSYTTLVSCPFTMPTGVATSRRVLALGYLVLHVGTVGNVYIVTGMTDATTGPIAAPFPAFGSAPAKAPNPTTGSGAPYGMTVLSWNTGALPSAGAHTMTLRGANQVAGTFTATWAGLMVALV